GNRADGFAGSVTVAIGSNPAGGSLSGTTTVAAVGGVAVFPTLSIDRAGVGYTLSATAARLTEAASAPFDITTVRPNQLVFTVPPTGTAAGATISPAVQVTARDAAGQTATGFTGNVTLTITAGTGTSGATLSGTTTATAVAGVATFSTLSIDQAESGYTLAATADGLSGATSTAFAITAGLPVRLSFTVQPSSVAAGATIAPGVQLTALDAMDNLVPGFTGNVTVAIGTNPAGGTLSGTRTIAAVAGVATFSTLSIDKAGDGYTLAATTPDLASSTSAGFTIAPGTATQLAATVQPSTTTTGATIKPAVRVTAFDSLGNTATGFAGNVTVTLAFNPAGGTLSGTRTFAAIAGVATFPSLNIDNVGSGYTLAATAPGLTGTTSAAFDIIPSTATQLVFTVQPTDTAHRATAGVAITPPVEVTARDALGNTADGFTASVTVAIGQNPGVGTLSGTQTVAAVAGVASFPTLSVDRAGSGYTLVAAAAGPSGATSAPFDV